ncbi:methyltransferase domain-containing protein [Nocardia sp. NPDC004604]|uniref:SAM-dependent methyltransferase n=1 Tax=Nocardia sp. NPDC004604 TaxID=3157013 RepID=UPI0033A20542
MVIRGDNTVTAAGVASYYEEASELISADLSGLHFGYWQGLPAGSSMADASRRMTELMIDKVAITAGQRMLDIGCGTGQPAVELARVSGAEVVGIDLSPRHVRLANELADAESENDQVRFRLADVMDLPFEPESFDRAWMLESFFHMPDQSEVIRQIARVLRPGGRLVIANLVLRIPLNDEQDSALANLWKMGHVAALLPLANYSDLMAASGLVLDELLDISNDCIRPTFQAIRDLHAARRRAEAEKLDAPVELQDDMTAGMDLFSSTPEIGFAIIVASKPL